MFPLHTLGPASSFIRMHPWQRERHIHWVGLTESLEWIQSALAFTGGSRSSPDASSSWCLQHCTDSARLHKSSQAFDLIKWKGTIKRESLLFKRLSHLISIVISKLKNNVPPVGWSRHLRGWRRLPGAESACASRGGSGSAAPSRPIFRGRNLFLKSERTVVSGRGTV